MEGSEGENPRDWMHKRNQQNAVIPGRNALTQDLEQKKM